MKTALSHTCDSFCMMWMAEVWALQWMVATWAERNFSKLWRSSSLEWCVHKQDSKSAGVHVCGYGECMKVSLWARLLNIPYSIRGYEYDVIRTSLLLLPEQHWWHQRDTHSFPHPSGPTRMKGCLLLACNQGENMANPLWTSVVRTTGREPPFPTRLEIGGLSGT